MAQNTALTPFDYAGHTVRTVQIDDEPWFVAADACAVLELSNPRSSLALLDDDEKGVHTMDTPSGQQQMTIVNEAGLYSLILRSRKPEAKAFKRWITHEVLPALRRTGRYSVAQLGRRELAQMVLEEADRADRAERRAAELEPAANAWDRLASADGDFKVEQAAKILSRDPAIQLGERRLFTVLAERGWTFRARDGRWSPYQTHVENGDLSILPMSHYHPRTGELVLDAPQVRVTVKGLAKLHKLLGGVAALAVQQQLAFMDS